MKKGEMTMPVIVGAVLALIVLIVLISIFTGKAAWFNQNTGCEARGGTCALKSNNYECPGDEVVIITSECSIEEEKQVDGKTEKIKKPGRCCLPVE